MSRAKLSSLCPPDVSAARGWSADLPAPLLQPRTSELVSDDSDADSSHSPLEPLPALKSRLCRSLAQNPVAPP
eukprot:3114335-Pleurochrysis_carterae.AAC.1